MPETPQSALHPDTIDKIVSRCYEKYDILLEKDSATDFLDWYVKKHLRLDQDDIERLGEVKKNKGYPMNELTEAVAVLGIYIEHLKKTGDSLTLPDLDGSLSKHVSKINTALNKINDYSANISVSVPQANELGNRVREYLQTVSYQIKGYTTLGSGLKIYVRDPTRAKVERLRKDAKKHFKDEPYVGVFTSVNDIKDGCITLSNRASLNSVATFESVQFMMVEYAKTIIQRQHQDKQLFV